MSYIDRRSSNGMTPISHYFKKITYKAFEKQHALLPQIIFNWYKIVGSDFAKITYPDKIISNFVDNKKINILYVKMTDHSKKMFLYYKTNIFLERISIYIPSDYIHEIIFL